VRRSLARRTLLSLGLAGSLTAQALAVSTHSQAAGGTTSGGGISSDVLRARTGTQTRLTSDQARSLSQQANQRVIVILKDQFNYIPDVGVTRAQRINRVSADQSSIMSELQQLRAPNVHSFQIINAVAATVSPDEEARLKANPRVQAVISDRVVYPARVVTDPDGLGSATAAVATASGIQPPIAPRAQLRDGGIPSSSCSSTLSLEPEPLQLDNAAFPDNRPSAQTLLGGPSNAGAGVKVAFFAEGVDTTLPDFTRADGTPVITQIDFSGDGPSPPAPTSGLEAFLDGSSIAAQGRQIYDITKPVSAGGAGVFVNPQYNAGQTCKIRVSGMAPAAQVYDLKVFPPSVGQYNSVIVQAIEYAVQVANVDVLSESFGSQNTPDQFNDPVQLANDAAVAAGKTVVVSTGDQGLNTIGTPSTDPNVIAAGATTDLRFFQQTASAGIQLGNGDYVSNNVSDISSTGFAEKAPRTIDVVAGGDFSWVLCSTNRAIFRDCHDYEKPAQPSELLGVGGTSESCPLTAGEAALVIQAYRQAHNGVTPSPAMVKQIIKSTATDLRVPTSEQGAGLLNAYKAVQAALSVRDGNGTPASPVGNALLVAPDAATITDAPGTMETFPVTVTNAGAAPQVVFAATQFVRGQGGVQTLGAPVYTASFNPALSSSGPTFTTIGYSGPATRAYQEQDFALPASADRLDVSYSFDAVNQPNGLVGLDLFDPQNRLVARTFPSPQGNGFGHVSVRLPVAGTYRAIFITTPGGATAYNGTVHLDVAASNFVAAGTVSPRGFVLAPGQSRAFTVSIKTPAQPGTLSAELTLNTVRGLSVNTLLKLSLGRAPGSGGGGCAALSSAPAGCIAVPISLRSTVPLGPTGGSFTGTTTGNNNNGAGPILTYPFNVPAGQSDLDISFALNNADANNSLGGVLVDPNGQAINIESTQANADAKTGAPTAYASTMQFFRRDPQPGTYQLVLITGGKVSGQTTSLPFTVNIGFNGVNVSSNLPNSPSTTIVSGTAQAYQVTLTNTGNTTKDFYVDGRLDPATYGYASFNPTIIPTNTVSLRDPGADFAAGPPFYIVPPESTNTVATAESMSPTVPLRLELDTAGLGEVGVVSGPSTKNAAGNYVASVGASAPELGTGFYGIVPAQVGPFPAPTTPTTVTLMATVVTQAPDFDESASTDRTNLTLAPGQSGTITVQLAPSGANGGPGSTVHGIL